MAEAAILPTRLVAYTNANWYEEPFQFFSGSITTPDNFSGASAKMGLLLAGATTNAIELSTANGTLTITQPNEIGVTVPEATMATLAPGVYAFDLVVTYGNGDIETVLAGQVRIVAGIS